MTIFPAFLHWPVNVDWVAAGAVATFCAVLVALWPIYAEHQRHKAIAQVLRGRLFAELGVFRMSLQLACDHWPAAGGAKVEMSSLPVGDVAGKVDALMDHAHLLKPDEYESLILVHSNLRLALRLRHMSLDSARELLALTETALGGLLRGGFLKGKLLLPSPTESSDQDTGVPK